MKEKKKISILVVSMLGILILLVGTSYALFTTMVQGTKSNVVTSGTLKTTFTEAGSVLNLTNAYPVTDSVGWNSTAYSFTIKNTGSLDVSYQIKIEENEALYTSHNDAGKIFPDNTLKIGLQKTGESTPSYIPYARQVLKDGVIKAGESVTYTMRMWIDYNTGNEVQGNHFHGKIAVHSSQYYENATVANAPELDDGMIPVIYDEASSSWMNADINSEWYNYEKQNWANAVTVTSTNRATLLASAPGTVIPISDINTMWVWIPRYSYTIGNTYGVQLTGGSTPSKLTPGAIDIKFVSKTDALENGTAKYTGDTPNEWYTHPAFCLGNLTTVDNRTTCDGEEVNGIWVGKFETGAPETDACTTSPSTANCNKNTLSPISKPNISSWRYISISNMFYAALNNMNGTLGKETYGFSLTGNSHMMKNMEWGTVAYLTQSKYGKYGNAMYTGANKELYNNNYAQVDSEPYITMTGCSGGSPSLAASFGLCAYSYDQITDRGNGTGSGGGGASTTGNISGIYDISGSAWEYVMGNLNGTIAKSEFTVLPELKHYNKYSGTVSSKGDATNADGTNNWYKDDQYYTGSSNPWFIRGGYWTSKTYTGAFCYGAYPGQAMHTLSFRLVHIGKV